MGRAHALVLSLAIGVAAVAGTIAATRTVTLGARAADTQVAARSARLDRFEASLRRAAADRPPALPPLRSAADATAPPTSAPRVIYVRPASVPVLASREDAEHEQGRDEEAGEQDDD